MTIVEDDHCGLAAICEDKLQILTADNSLEVKMLAALAHETRLKVFKILVEIGEEGCCPCHIAEALHIARNTLSFHLNGLAQAGLVNIRREGKFLYYSPNLQNLKLLTSYLGHAGIMEEGKYNV